MNILRTLCMNFLPIFSVLSLCVYLLGLLSLHFSDRNNYCAMTYMFEYPQFVRISVPETDNFPGYGLYAYSEGRFTERARKMWFDGVPVLYLPGNSGSHMQARSLASVALRMSLSSDTDFHFDYYTISFNEEMSGLYGGVLEKQTQFATASIQAILGLYKENRYRKSIPTAVILIGHSMGGVVAKRLLAQPNSINKTNIAIALAAPLEAPVVNFDETMNDFYTKIDHEWENNIRNNEEVKENKMLLSFGGGPRDVLVPSGLTTDDDGYVNALTTSIPGVWVSPDHVGIVWCKQLVMAINRFLFSIVNPANEQVYENMDIVRSKAKMFFENNRSMSPHTTHATSVMYSDAFWYEDNRRIYQISRPEIDKMTYLMIRLVAFPQNRFAAIEAVNVSDKDWIFGCNAKDVYNMYRYCDTATSLSELSRWTSAAPNFGKRKLATVHLHNVAQIYPDWTHVIVKVSPTRKPVTLNVDVNDYASRVKLVQVPSGFSIGKSAILQQTEPDSVYYEIVLEGFTNVQQAFLLYIEPSPDCKATKYHVSAELHVPWAKNHETYHFFTHEKKSPMKLRLMSSRPSATLNVINEPAKVTVLLDPQCTFSMSISIEWYHRLAQMVRHYTPVVIPYMGGILLLALRNTLINIILNDVPLPVHVALNSRAINPFFSVITIFAMTATLRMLKPWIPFIVTAGWKNREITESFVETISIMLIYFTALGILNVSAVVIRAMLMLSSQITHRICYRILWCGPTNFAERVASGLQKVPLVVSFMLLFGAPLSCGAASLVVGAAFYAFLLSKMYEEYLEDYVYSYVVKFVLRICRRLFKSKAPRRRENNPTPETETISGQLMNSGDNPIPEENPTSKDNQTSRAAQPSSEAHLIAESKQTAAAKTTSESSSIGTKDETKANDRSANRDSKPEQTTPEGNTEDNTEGNTEIDKDEELDEQRNCLNFHMLLFLLWLMVTIVNLPALLTWAKNFNEDPILRIDTSSSQSLLMSFSTAYVFQMKPPRKNLYSYNAITHLILIMAMIVFVLGPTTLYLVGHVITLIFMLITAQQMFDKIVDVEYSYTFFDDILSTSAYFKSPKKDKTVKRNLETATHEEKGEIVSEHQVSAEVSSNASPSATASTGTSSATSTSNDQPANDLDQPKELDEGSIMNKIKMLKEKLSFLEHT